MSNTYAFGDIHGGYDKLKALIEKINIDSSDTLVFLGDYIDRGPKSYEVMEYLIKLNKEYNCIFIRGNHEEMLLDYLYGIYEKVFLRNGGKATILSYKENGYNIEAELDHRLRQFPESHFKFINKTLPYHETENYIFVHAGINPRIPLSDTDTETFMWDRYFYHLSGYKGKKVIFGHTPNRKVMRTKHKICIDTGSCFEDMGGKLTCVKLPEEIFIDQGAILNGTHDNCRTVTQDEKNT